MLNIKSLLRVLVLTFLAFPIFTVGALAEGNSLDYDELRELHQEVKELVLSGNEDLVDQLPGVKKYKKIFNENPDLQEEYLDSLEALNNEKNLAVNTNDQNIVEFGDGSFIVVGGETTGVDENGNKITPEDNDEYTLFADDLGPDVFVGTVGSTVTTDHYKQVWGIYLAFEGHLVTEYRIDNINTLNVASRSIAGSRSYYPTTYTGSATTLIGLGDPIRTRADFTVIDYLVAPGLPGRTTSHTLTTTAEITSSVGTNVGIRASSVWQ